MLCGSHAKESCRLSLSFQPHADLVSGSGQIATPRAVKRGDPLHPFSGSHGTWQETGASQEATESQERGTVLVRVCVGVAFVSQPAGAQASSDSFLAHRAFVPLPEKGQKPKLEARSPAAGKTRHTRSLGSGRLASRLGLCPLACDCVTLLRASSLALTASASWGLSTETTPRTERPVLWHSAVNHCPRPCCESQPYPSMWRTEPESGSTTKKTL